MKRIFIIGVGRSGTSLLHAMLAAHPDVASAPETGLLRRYVGKRRLERVAKNSSLQAAIGQLENDAQFQRLGLSATSILEASVKSGLPLDIGAYYEITRCLGSENETFLDKDPRLAEDLPVIKAHFPFSYVVHIVRDPRDVIISKQRALWSKGQPLWRQLFAGAAQVNLAQKHGPALFGERYITLKYETLIAEPHTTLEALCDRLNLEFKADMLAYRDSARKIVSDDELAWKSTTLEAVRSDNSKKWGDALSQDTVALTEACNQQAMVLGDYARTTRKVGIKATAINACAAIYAKWHSWQHDKRSHGYLTEQGRVVWHDASKVCRATGNEIFVSTDAGANWDQSPSLPLKLQERIAGKSTILSRLLRLGFHHLVVSPAASMIIWGRKTFVQTGKTVSEAGRVAGSRPLGLTFANNAFYFGEYRQNKERSPVSVWRWAKGVEVWTPAWTFDDVRHVHGVFHDPFSHAIWVTTGDEDSESAIWRTDDEFATLRRVLGGSQQYRAVDLLFTDSHIYYGTDAPGQANFIYRMDRSSHAIEKLLEVAGPVMHGARSGDALFFSTSVEPKHAQTDTTKRSSVEVWGSQDGKDWVRVATYRKDPWPMRLFQYGQALFPSGPGDGQRMFVSPFAAGKHGQTHMMLLD